MEKLNLYTADADYVNWLREAETAKRGFSRVPDMSIPKDRRPKVLCGVFLDLGGTGYLVPMSSYKTQKHDNFLIMIENRQTVGSLRFNYMFPTPPGALAVRKITDEEPHGVVRAFLSQQLRYCNKNRDLVLRLAARTRRRVLLGKDPGLVFNSCDFALLEEKCKEYAALPAQKEI